MAARTAAAVSVRSGSTACGPGRGQLGGGRAAGGHADRPGPGRQRGGHVQRSVTDHYRGLAGEVRCRTCGRRWPRAMWHQFRPDLVVLAVGAGFQVEMAVQPERPRASPRPSAGRSRSAPTAPRLPAVPRRDRRRPGPGRRPPARPARRRHRAVPGCAARSARGRSGASAGPARQELVHVPPRLGDPRAWPGCPAMIARSVRPAIGAAASAGRAPNMSRKTDPVQAAGRLRPHRSG